MKKKVLKSVLLSIEEILNYFKKTIDINTIPQKYKRKVVFLDNGIDTKYEQEQDYWTFLRTQKDETKDFKDFKSTQACLKVLLDEKLLSKPNFSNLKNPTFSQIAPFLFGNSIFHMLYSYLQTTNSFDLQISKLETIYQEFEQKILETESQTHLFVPIYNFSADFKSLKIDNDIYIELLDIEEKNSLIETDFFPETHDLMFIKDCNYKICATINHGKGNLDQAQVKNIEEKFKNLITALRLVGTGYFCPFIIIKKFSSSLFSMHRIETYLQDNSPNLKLYHFEKKNHQN